MAAGCQRRRLADSPTAPTAGRSQSGEIDRPIPGKPGTQHDQRFWPTCSDSHRAQRPDGPPSPHVTGVNTPRCAATPKHRRSDQRPHQSTGAQQPQDSRRGRLNAGDADEIAAPRDKRLPARWLRRSKLARDRDTWQAKPGSTLRRPGRRRSRQEPHDVETTAAYQEVSTHVIPESARRRAPSVRARNRLTKSTN
jgi:hypothetical protein